MDLSRKGGSGLLRSPKEGSPSAWLARRGLGVVSLGEGLRGTGGEDQEMERDKAGARWVCPALTFTRERGGQVTNLAGVLRLRGGRPKSRAPMPFVCERGR